MELSWRRLRQKSVKRSRTSSSRTTASAWTDAAKDTLTTPVPPAGKSDDSVQRDYDLPIPSRKALPDDYERDDDNNKTNEEVAPRTLHPRLLLPPSRQMIVPRGIETNPSIPERRFPTTMNAKTTTTTETKKSREGISWS